MRYSLKLPLRAVWGAKQELSSDTDGRAVDKKCVAWLKITHSWPLGGLQERNGAIIGDLKAVTGDLKVISRPSGLKAM